MREYGQSSYASYAELFSIHSWFIVRHRYRFSLVISTLQLTVDIFRYIYNSKASNNSCQTFISWHCARYVLQL